MKSLTLALLVAGFLVGCTQPKNRLADLKNKEYQKRLAESRQKEGAKGPVIFQDTDNNGQTLPEGSLPTPPSTPDVASTRSQYSEGSGAESGSVTLPRVVTTPQENTNVDTSLVEEARRQPLNQQPAPQSPQSDSDKTGTASVNENQKTTGSDPVSGSDRDQSVAAGSNPATSAQSGASQEPDSNGNNTGKGNQQPSTVDANNGSENQGNTTANSAGNVADEAFLTFEEYYLLGQVLSKVFETPENFKAFASNIASESIRLISAEHKDKKLNLKIGDSGRILGEIEGIHLEPNKGTQAELGDLKFLGLCTYPDCSIYFFTLHKIENNAMVFNFPMVLKLVKGQYVEAKLHPSEFYQKALKEYAAKQKATNESK